YRCRLQHGDMLNAQGSMRDAHSGVTRHLLRDAAMLVITKHLAETGPAPGRDRRREKALFRLAVARERFLRTFVRNASVLDRVDQRLEHGGLHFRVTRPVP